MRDRSYGRMEVGLGREEMGIDLLFTYAMHNEWIGGFDVAGWVVVSASALLARAGWL